MFIIDSNMLSFDLSVRFAVVNKKCASYIDLKSHPAGRRLSKSVDSYVSSGSGGGRGGHAPPPVTVNISHKKMATEGSRIDFMFLAPLTRLLDPLLYVMYNSKETACAHTYI